MHETTVRTARPEDIPGLLALQHACYPLLSTVARWGPEHMLSHQRRFGEGQFVADAGRGTVVGYCATFVTSSAKALRPHTFRGITGRGTFSTHDPRGDTLYGAEIMVHPDHRRRGVARRFYAARFALARRLGLRYFVAGGRLPGYEDHRKALTPKAYVAEVVAGRLTDRVLSAQLRVGLRVHGVMPDYLPDPRSGNFASLLVWENPDVAGGGKPHPPAPGEAGLPVEA